ncbi:MAG: alpha/beta hydrolase [Planctomycetota bacterium]
MRRRSSAVLLCSLFAACNSVHDDLTRQLLRPPQGWLCEPADFGIAAEQVDIALGSGASLTGFWLPNPAAQGRTVVLVHEEGTNVSAQHPYYRFLHDAGFQVLTFDPRGYGRSKGKPSLRAWLRDLDSVYAWLHERADVDPHRIALFGTALGSVAAMWAARMHGETAAVVFEHLPSIRDMLKATVKDPDSALGAYTVGMLEFSGMPEDIEPADNAPLVKARALFVATDGEPELDRRGLLRAYAAYAGAKDLWVVSGTGRAPHAMLTHDGEYQRRIVEFLTGALGGQPTGIAASSQKVADASDGEGWYEIRVQAAGTAPAEPWAVEACAVLADGTPHYTRTWVEGNAGRTRIKLPRDPAFVSAGRVFAAVRDDDAVFRAETTPLSRSGAAVADLWPRIELVRNGKATLAEATELAAALAAATAEEPFHAALEAELADVFARLGLAFADAGDAAVQGRAKAWLERGLAARPAHPERHFWPGPVATYGFSYERLDVLDAAKRKLAALAGK